MVTFAVDEDAEPATALLATRAVAELSPGAICIGDPTRHVVDCRASGNDGYWIDGVHPLLGAVALAFTQHRPLVLTPDSVWLTIAQGVAQHVRDRAEELRPRLVRHAGKRLLELSVGRSPECAADWAAIVADLRELLASEIGDGHARLFECTFSTSSDTDLVASRIVLFDAYSPYFEY